MSFAYLKKLYFLPDFKVILQIKQSSPIFVMCWSIFLIICIISVCDIFPHRRAKLFPFYYEKYEAESIERII